MCAHVSELENPVSTELLLQAQVPLLRVGDDKMTRHDQTKNSRRRDAGPAAGVVRGLGSVVSREALEGCQARDEIRINHPRKRQRVRIGVRAAGQWRRREESAQATRSTTAERDRQEWRLEAELVHGTDVFANVVDAVAAAECGRVVTEDVPRETEARPIARAVIVLVS